MRDAQMNRPARGGHPEPAAGDEAHRDDTGPYDFMAYALDHSLRMEAKHKRLCWIDQAPVWVSAAEWLHGVGVLARPPREREKSLGVRLRLTLPGDSPRDEVSISVAYQKRALPELASQFHRAWGIAKVTVTAMAWEEGRLRAFAGTVDDLGSEMHRCCIVGMPEPQAERVAHLLRTIGAEIPGADLFAYSDERAALALMRAIQPHRADRGRCVRCLRPLTDPASKARGIGPECLAKFGRGAT